MIEIKTENRIDAGSCNVCGVNPYVDDRCPETVEVLYVGGNNSTTQLRFCIKCFDAFAAVVAGHKSRLGGYGKYRGLPKLVMPNYLGKKKKNP